MPGDALVDDDAEADADAVVEADADGLAFGWVVMPFFAASASACEA